MIAAPGRWMMINPEVGGVIEADCSMLFSILVVIFVHFVAKKMCWNIFTVL
jgi:hypothetical protein